MPSRRHPIRSSHVDASRVGFASRIPANLHDSRSVTASFEALAFQPSKNPAHSVAERARAARFGDEVEMPVLDGELDHAEAIAMGSADPFAPTLEAKS